MDNKYHHSPTIENPLTKVQPRNARIMIANLVVIVLPSIEMHMLILGTARRSRAHIHVVKSLAVQVKEVRISLVGGDVGDLVQVREAGLVGEDLKGLDLDEVVEVAGCDDIGLGILLEDLGDEVLGYLVSHFLTSWI